MNHIVTLDQLLNISKNISNNVEQNKIYNILLDENICNNYDIIEIKKKLQSLFTSFKSARYLYEFPVECSISISANYEEKLGSFTQRNNISKIEQAIQKYTDKQLHTTNVYNTIMILSLKLTGDESIYLINTFLAHKSEDDIAEMIGVSKSYLQKIKKSCIVKMWIDLKKYCEKDD